MAGGKVRQPTQNAYPTRFVLNRDEFQIKGYIQPFFFQRPINAERALYFATNACKRRLKPAWVP